MYAGHLCPHGRKIPLTVPGLVLFAPLVVAAIVLAGCVGSVSDRGGDVPSKGAPPTSNPTPPGVVPAACGKDATPGRIWLSWLITWTLMETCLSQTTRSEELPLKMESFPSQTRRRNWGCG